MVSVQLIPFSRSDAADLADLLTGEEWPFHSGGAITREELLERVSAGYYDEPMVRTWWLVTEGRQRAGVVRAWDVGDGAPLFDLRLRSACRGRGVGRAAVREVTRALFDEQPDLTRIEATTRLDNVPMRRVLDACGYVKEAHYRRSWPGQDGLLHDTVGYAVLREDWTSGTVTPVAWQS